MSLIEIVQLTLAFLPAVILHEWAHGWVANRLGDPTAKEAGRLSLNPLRHIDPVGSLLVPGLLVLANSHIVFGWAKPVPVNFSLLRHPRRDMILVAMAGPLINVGFAALLSTGLWVHPPAMVYEALALAVVVNLVLAFFNLIPIPPLDGSRLVLGLLPLRLARWFAKLERWGIFIVLGLWYLGLLEWFVWPAVVFFARLLGVSLDVLN